MVFLLMFLVIAYCSAGLAKTEYKFFPNLPSGEYKVKVNAILNCNTNKDTNKINFNWYISKKSVNSTEIRGNLTMKIPIDDSLFFNVKMAVKDSIGGWKDNAFVYKTPKACTTFKNLMGNVWNEFVNSFGINFDCPTPAGVYVSSGFDTSRIEDSNFPKNFFYGTYKARFYYSDKVENYGCVMVIVEIKRPWENI